MYSTNIALVQVALGSGLLSKVSDSSFMDRKKMWLREKISLKIVNMITKKILYNFKLSLIYNRWGFRKLKKKKYDINIIGKICSPLVGYILIISSFNNTSSMDNKNTDSATIIIRKEKVNLWHPIIWGWNSLHFMRWVFLLRGVTLKKIIVLRASNNNSTEDHNTLINGHRY